MSACELCQSTESFAMTILGKQSIHHKGGRRSAMASYVPITDEEALYICAATTEAHGLHA